MQIKNLLLFLMALLFVNSVHAIDMNANMAPVQDIIPGNYFGVQFSIVNGAVPLTNVTFELDSGSSFSVQGDNKIIYSALTPYQTLTLNYNLRADSDATTGFKGITLKAFTSNESMQRTFNVYVKSIESTLSIISVRSIPDKLVPGQNANVRITLENRASYSLKNINLKLDFSGVPFAPINSADEKNIERISDGSSEDVSFNIITLADAKTGVYKMPLRISYFDEFGKSYNDSNVISLIIGSVPNLDITIEKNSLVINNPSEISIKIVNNGLSDIKFLTVRLGQGDYEILSGDSVYVGNIDSDDYESIDFKLNPKKTNVAIPLTLVYKDANNEDYTKTALLSAKVYSESEAKSLGLIPSNNSMYIFAIVVLVFVIYFIYRRIKKRKHKNI